MTPTIDHQPKQPPCDFPEVYRQAAEEYAVTAVLDALMVKWPESTTTVLLELAEIIRKRQATNLT